MKTTQLYDIVEEETKLHNERTDFVGTYNRIEDGNVYLTDVVHAETLQKVADSLCFKYTGEFQSLGLEKYESGPLIMFNARILRGQDGYLLIAPTNVRGYLIPQPKYLDGGRIKVGVKRGRWVKGDTVV